MNEFLERISGVPGPGAAGSAAMLLSGTSTQRLGGYLLSLTDARLGRASVRLPHGKRALATHLGLRPESLCRSLNRLKNFDVIEHGGVVTIGNISRLREFCLGDDDEDKAGPPHSGSQT